MTPNNVIDIGEMRFKYERRTFAKTECKHLHLSLYSNGEYVMCDDCKTQISTYYALEMIVRQWGDAKIKEQSRIAALAESESKNLVLRAAQAVEKAWRSRSMFPSCPHCWRGIGPQDGFGASAVNREIEMRRRDEERKAKDKKRLEKVEE